MGKRGEGWVILQFILMAAIFFAPNSGQIGSTIRYLGLFLLLIGGTMLAIATLKLGRNLTPFPKPLDNGQLVRGGLYQIVRHPIYFSVIMACLGWAIWRGSFIGIGLSILLFFFFDAKTRAEERWLVQQYPDYVASPKGTRSEVSARGQTTHSLALLSSWWKIEPRTEGQFLGS